MRARHCAAKHPTTLSKSSLPPNDSCNLASVPGRTPPPPRSPGQRHPVVAAAHHKLSSPCFCPSLGGSFAAAMRRWLLRAGAGSRLPYAVGWSLKPKILGTYCSTLLGGLRATNGGSVNLCAGDRTLDKPRLSAHALAPRRGAPCYVLQSASFTHSLFTRSLAQPGAHLYIGYVISSRCGNVVPKYAPSMLHWYSERG
jgi:hypothetical protein